MAEFIERLARGSHESETSPNMVLESILGPSFSLYRRRFQRAEAGLGPRPPAPLHLDVDATTTCQLSCPMCPAGSPPEKNPFPGFGLFMEEETYLETLRQAAELSVPSMRLGITGEPLLCPDMDLWVGEARNSGFQDISLITNGQLLDVGTSRALIKAGLTRLMVSVDAATSETYSLARPGGDFDLLVNNLEGFLAARKEAGGRLPLLRLSFVLMRTNMGEASLFREKFSPLADYLAFQDYLNIMGTPGTDLRVTPGVAHSPDRPFRCPDPLTRLAVHTDGSLFPCCSDFGRLSPLGSVWDLGLAQCWNSRQAKFLATPEGRLNEECRRCLRAGQSGPGAGHVDGKQKSGQKSGRDGGQNDGRKNGRSCDKSAETDESGRREHISVAGLYPRPLPLSAISLAVDQETIMPVLRKPVSLRKEASLSARRRPARPGATPAQRKRTMVSLARKQPRHKAAVAELASMTAGPAATTTGPAPTTTGPAHDVCPDVLETPTVLTLEGVVEIVSDFEGAGDIMGDLELAALERTMEADSAMAERRG
ncbi:MAG: radical SAM protein [Deltaproteobacteria bacterium]|jgi:radical SAM protein with 4Fe4S-binding SPASM domain|nr:radical SAM protein [Deltaproteobacteria bacterium]